MFRAYGSLPPSECSSPLSPTTGAPSSPFDPAPATSSSSPWMTPSSVDTTTAVQVPLGRSLSLFETADVGHHQMDPIGQRQWSGGCYDNDDPVGLSQLLASARFFKSDRSNRMRTSTAAAKGELHVTWNGKPYLGLTFQ
ncbi:uncharacterized protein LOC135702963 [Ochlerotatus camptorhynchus]|uniref:uncharacterized protein LOC135702963 n=1 Tax=Ochlerotatus camptorhynchus TaxID=644619 RepID=UPI0031E31CCB